MRWFRKPTFIFSLLVLGAASTLVDRVAEAAPDSTKSAKTSKDKKPVKDKKKKDPTADDPDAPDKKAAADASADGTKSPTRMTVPIPVGHDAKKLVIPYRDDKGELQTRFTMEMGKRSDVDHMEMTTLLIETFDSGTPQMTIDLPQSVVDLNTRIITTKSGVVIKQFHPQRDDDGHIVTNENGEQINQADFELHGQTMEFNTETKQGRLGGKVRMLIYNLDNETDSDTPTPPNGP